MYGQFVKLLANLKNILTIFYTLDLQGCSGVGELSGLFGLLQVSILLAKLPQCAHSAKCSFKCINVCSAIP